MDINILTHIHNVICIQTYFIQMVQIKLIRIQTLKVNNVHTTEQLLVRYFTNADNIFDNNNI